MDYHEDYKPQRQPNRSGGKNDNDFGAWLLIGIMFLVAWPVGLILLIKKLTDNPQKLKMRPPPPQPTSGRRRRSRSRQRPRRPRSKRPALSRRSPRRLSPPREGPE